MPSKIYRTITPYRQYAISGYYWPPGTRTGGSSSVTINTSGKKDWGDSLTYRIDKQSNPDWKIKVKKKQDASSPYLRREVTITPGVAFHQTEYLNTVYGNIEYGSDSHTYSALPSFSSLSDEDVALADLANTRLKRKLANRTKSANLIIPVMELRELRQTINGAANASMKTLLLLADVKKTLKSSLRTIKSPQRLKKALRSAYKDASDIWLTYSFGINPMIGTIQDINKSIAAYLTRYDSIDRLTGSATKTWFKSFMATNSQTSCNGTSWRAWSRETWELKYKYTAGHRFLLESANDYGALDHFGVGVPSLVPAAWELTAFSWVIDYFTTAGQFLDDTFTGTTGNSVYVVKNRKCTVKGSTSIEFYKAQPSATYLKFSTKNLDAEYNAFEFQRSVLSSYPPRVLRFRTLDEMGLNGVSKLLNLASILSKSV